MMEQDEKELSDVAQPDVSDTTDEAPSSVVQPDVAEATDETASSVVVSDVSDTIDETASSPENLQSSAVASPAAPVAASGEAPTTLDDTDAAGQKKTAPSISPFRDSMRRFARDKRAMISVGFMLFLVVLAIAGPPIYQHIGGLYPSDLQGKIGPEIYHRYDHQELSKINQGPSAQYWLGTDALGEDMLARMMQGVLISITVALLVEVVDIGLGVTVGILAGYYGGWIDTLLARFTDLVFAFPGLLFAILLTGIFGANANDYFSGLPIIGHFLGNGNAMLVLISLALALVAWPMMARYVRGQTLQLRQQQFIEAARTMGTKDIVIMWKHIVPNLFNIVFVTATMNIAGTIIGESGLSLLGLGVVHPGSSLGLMIADGIDILSVHPWNTIFPTAVLTGIVLAISFIGDGLGDAFDPYTKD